MKKAAIKEEREITIFKDFVEKSQMQVIPGSIFSCKPPEPDIICEVINEGVVRFELTEACAPEFAEAFNNPRPKGVHSCFGRDVSEQTLRNKLKKDYPVEGPIELLVYTDGKTAKPDFLLLLEFQDILNGGQGQFRRVWLMGDQVHEVWRGFS